MPNIQLNYLYRDYANYKNHGAAIFTNPDNLSLEHIEAALSANLMDGEWFYASRWEVKDLHFVSSASLTMTYGEDDHPYHEFASVELTEEEATDGDVSEFLERVVKGGKECRV